MSLSDPVEWMRTALDPARLFGHAGMTADGWQAETMRTEGDRILICASRQVGKSQTTALRAIHRAVFHQDSLILLFAPSQRQSQELFKKVVDSYHRLDDPVPIVKELATSLELGNGSRVLSLPGDPATVRGFSAVDLVVVDEAALVASDALFTAVLPMLAVSKGSLVLLSTPYGRRGWFYEAWTGPDDGWRKIAATASACPRIDPAFLADQRAKLGDRWYAQEYECQFVDTIGAVFTEELIAGIFADHDAPLLEGW